MGMNINLFWKKTVVAGTLLAFLLGVPHVSSAATDDLEVSGWIPYWRAEQGVKDATKHLDQIDVLFPFAFTVKSDGTLKDLAGLDMKNWQTLFKIARKKKVDVIPTIMMSDPDLSFNILSDSKKRATHVKNIVDMVKKGKYDGVDIDYEGKRASSRVYFSLFLIELKLALSNKTLSCTIESRTPPESAYNTIPSTIEYSNDFTTINLACDRVQVMTYDQQRADLKLNKSKIGLPYIPISDVDWVEKVMNLTDNSISKDKLSIGLASYGHNYQITVAPDWFRDYMRLGALNVPDMLDLSKEFKVTPSQNSAGEQSISYLPKGTTVKFPSNLKIPKGTESGHKVAAQALAYANKTGKEVIIRYVTWSDAEAMKQKIDLAKELGLRGVALFKIDGDEDQKVWDYLK